MSITLEKYLNKPLDPQEISIVHKTAEKFIDQFLNPGAELPADAIISEGSKKQKYVVKNDTEMTILKNIGSFI